jgi:DNA-binding NarL/FixJ family response regulator
MNLIARAGGVADIPEWLALHRSLSIPYSKVEWCALPELWRELLPSGRLTFFLVEDRMRSAIRIVTCCAALFVTDEFCTEARSTRMSFLGIELARRYLSGNLPVLTRTEIAHANATQGLNLVVCFEGPERSVLLGEHYLELHEKRSKAFHLAIDGYQVKEFLANPIGDQAYEETIDAGARLRCDYSKADATGNGYSSRWLRTRRLVGLTKKEAEARPGSYLAGLFVCSPPRFHFSPSEQKLLEHALTGQTCEDLAASLSLSPWTIKKRWQAIYERVTAVDGELLPRTVPEGQAAQSRGEERRRRLLSYLRQHPEELRPWCARLISDRVPAQSSFSRS